MVVGSRKPPNLVLFGALLGVFFPMVFVDGLGWGISHHFCRFWVTFWLHFGSPGLLGAPLGQDFASLFARWAPKGCSWDVLGALWGVIGSLRGPLGGPGLTFDTEMAPKLS